MELQTQFPHVLSWAFKAGIQQNHIVRVLEQKAHLQNTIRRNADPGRVRMYPETESLRKVGSGIQDDPGWI